MGKESLSVQNIRDMLVFYAIEEYSMGKYKVLVV